jgi:hypothetical protein
MTIRTAACRHRLAFVTAGVGLLVAVGLAVPAPASAHTGAASAVASCPAPSNGTGRIVYTVSNDHPLVATVTASDNAAIAVGATIPKSGSKSFTQTVPAPAAGVTGSANLTVRWSDGFTQSGIVASATVGADCTGPVTVVVPELPVLPPTCTEPGSLPWTSNPLAQNANGYEFPGQGYRAYLDHAYVGAGTYVVTVQKVGAGFDAAFPNGTKVTGATSQTLTVLPAIGNQTADASAPCFTRPEQPEPKVTYTEWKDAENNCTVDVIVQTRDMVTTTYTWDESEGEYVASVVTEQEVQQRPKTDQEKEACVIVTPPTDQPTEPTPTAPTTAPAPSPTSPSGTTSVRGTTPASNSTPEPTRTAVSAAEDTTPTNLAYTGSPLTMGAQIALVAAAVLAIGFGALLLTLRTMRRNRRRDAE